MGAPNAGDTSTCSMCQKPITFIDGYWRHDGEAQPRHPATPSALSSVAVVTAVLAPLPLRVAYKGAATIEAANGEIVAECPTPEVAAALVEAVNNTRPGAPDWHAIADQYARDVLRWQATAEMLNQRNNVAWQLVGRFSWSAERTLEALKNRGAWARDPAKLLSMALEEMNKVLDKPGKG